METQGLPLGGQWGLVIIMSLVGTWVVFRYLVPKSWKEWRNAGLVQAFLIALYAEMYGFPLTIYFLTSYLDLNIPWIHLRGHLWSTLLGLGDTGAIIEMMLGLSVTLIGLFMLMRGWRQIYQGSKEGILVTGGLYQYMRHPQYTAIFIAMTGQLIHWPTVPTLVLFPIIVFAYYRLALREEKVMLDAFGDEYRKYMLNVPRFIPKREHWADAVDDE